MSMKLKMLRPQILDGYITIEDAIKEAEKLRDSEFEVVHDTGNLDSVLRQLNTFTANFKLKDESNLLSIRDLAPVEETK